MKSMRALERLSRRIRGRSDYATASTSTQKPLSPTNGPWSFGDQSYTGLEEHFDKRPLLDTVPLGRLILPSPNRPFQVLKHSDRIIQSGYGIVHESNKLGVSTADLWVKENVQVFSKMGSFALKDVDLSNVRTLTPAEKQLSFQGYNKFLKALISEAHGPESLGKLPDDLSDVDVIIKELHTDENLAELVVYNPSFLPPRPKALLYLMLYNLLVKKIPLLLKRKLPIPGFVPTAQHPDAQSLLNDLLAAVPYTFQDLDNEAWGTVIAQRNLPIFSVWATLTAMSRDDAKGLLTMLRVGVSHPVEEKMVQAMVDAAHMANSTLNQTAPTFEEVVLFFDYYLPRVAPALAREFYRFGVYEWLNMWDLFPVRSVDCS